MAALAAAAVAASAASPKRGVCWDEGNLPLGTAQAALLAPGVSWAYNWGPDAAVPEAYGDSFCFLPMAWNGAYDDARIRAWLTAHPETRYLLGFNEPNFADQARMTPAQAAEAWPALEAIAAEFGLKLVAPALNFSASQVGGRVWNPYEWYDEFFRLRPAAKVDCLAMHCYMNWYSANTWLATEYFYTDLYNPQKDCYGRYPHLVAFLDSFKDANGRFPKMMLTEFCSWENDGTIKDVGFQIDQMTQKVQKLEQSNLVEGYAWFMADPAGGAGAYPYMSLLQSCSPSSGLSELGTVYVHMSSFDKERFFTPGETVAASDYVDATTDGARISVRSNSDDASALPLRIEVPVSGYATYQIDVPAPGSYKFVFRTSAEAAGSLLLYVDNKKAAQAAIPASGWTDVELTVSLAAGHHSVMPYNGGTAPFLMNAFSFSATDGIAEAEAHAPAQGAFFTLAGLPARPASAARGIYIERRSDGSYRKIRK